MSETTDDYSNLSYKALVFRFVKNSSTYGVFQFVVQFGAFFITPIYWQFLSPEDYGILGVTAVLSGVLSPVIILGLHGGVERFYYEWQPEERPKKLGAIWSLSILVALFLTLIVDASANYVFPRLFTQVPYDPYFKITLWTVLLSSFRYIPFNILRVTEDVKTYGITSSLSFFINAGLVVFFLAVLGLRVEGVLLGGLIMNGVLAIFWIAWTFRRVKLNLHFAAIKEEVYYSLPSIPINLLESVGKNLDRFLLEKHFDLTQLGYYNVARRFGAYYSQINASLKTAWFPMTYKMVAQRHDTKRFLPSLSLFYFYVLTVFALAASLLLKEIIYWFGRERYILAYQFVPLFIFAYLVMGLGTAWGRGLDLAKKPQYTLFSTIPGIAASVVLLYLLVPKYGNYGALIALLISSCVRSLSFVWLAHVFYPRKFLYREVLLIIFLLACFFCTGYQVELNNNLMNFLLKTLLIVGYVILAGLITFGYNRVITQLSKFKSRIQNGKAAAKG